MINEKKEDNIIIAEFDHGKTNSLTLETFRKLREIVKKANEDESVNGIILTGAGKAFSSGFHLPIFLNFKNKKEAVEFFLEEEEILLELFMCKKPVVSAINGHCIAGGLILAMASDYRIAKNHPKIKINMSEIKLGVSLTIAQAEIMKFGLDSDRKFRDIMFFAEMYDVKKALDFGIVDELAEEDNLMERAKEVVSTWANNPGNSYSSLKTRLKKPVFMKIKHIMETENLEDELSMFFQEDTRNSISAVHSLMSG